MFFAALKTPLMQVLSGGIKRTPMKYVLRNMTERDIDWLYNLRTKTMSKYIIDSGDQFTQESQTGRILKEYESIKIVRVGNQDIGMFKVKRDSSEWSIIQIQLIPSFQRFGIGSDLVQSLQIEALKKKIPVFLSVLKVNPARHLYERLGFEIVEETGKSYTMLYSA